MAYPVQAPATGKNAPDILTAQHYRRIRLLFWMFLIVFVGIGVRLAVLQLNPDHRFSKEDLKHIGEVPLLVPRGNIYERNGLLLATDKPLPALWANPYEIKRKGVDARALAGVLATPLGLDWENVYARLTQTSAQGAPMKFTYVKQRLSDTECDLLRQLNLIDGKMLAIRIEPTRFYPQHTMAAHLLGFVNRERVGCEGIEMGYDSYLRSTPGKRVARKDNRHNLLESLTLEYKEPEGGDNVYLTIHATLQDGLERGLAEAVQQYNAVRASGVLIDPKTGAILALACVPAYNPNEYMGASPELLKNHAVIDVFEPGSAFKVVAAAAALEEKLITPERTIDCEGGIFNPYGHAIKDVHKMGVEPFSQCFAQSSNIAIIKVGAMLGPERMESWIRTFGFGEKTCPDFRTETSGIVHPRKKWSRLTMGSLPMGQEIAVSTLQLVRAYAAVANGGYLIQPYLVENVVARDGTFTYMHEAPPPKRILSPETSEIMKTLCHLVVTDGTGKKANIPEYRVGGKTGTAQIAKAGGGGFEEGRYTAIFCGFAPVGDPKIAAAIIVNEPRGKIYGGTVAAPIFKAVVRDALIALHVPTDPVATLVAENAADADDADTVTAKLDAALCELPDDASATTLDGLDLIAFGQAPVLGAATLPDLKGLTRRQAMEALRILGLPADIRGSGWVTSQEPPPGTPVPNISLCRLELRSKSETNHALAPTQKTAGM